MRSAVKDEKCMWESSKEWAKSETNIGKSEPNNSIQKGAGLEYQIEGCSFKYKVNPFLV